MNINQEIMMNSALRNVHKKYSKEVFRIWNSSGKMTVEQVAVFVAQFFIDNDITDVKLQNEFLLYVLWSSETGEFYCDPINPKKITHEEAQERMKKARGN